MFLTSIFSALLCASFLTTVYGHSVFDVGSIRLPNDTKPISYDIHLTTNIHKADFEFDGIVTIILEAVVDTEQITLHADALENFKVNLVDIQSGVEYSELQTRYFSGRNLLKISLQTDHLKAGNRYSLTISYKGKHDDSLFGFYRSYYKNKDGEKVWFAISHFEPSAARKAFPCYDEPAFKATFLIKITHGSKYTAIANTEADGEPVVSDDEMATTTFKRTPPMSTYNVAFAVSDYSMNSDTIHNVTQRVFYPPTSIYHGDFIMTTAGKALHAMEQTFEVNYPFSKVDHISVSKRFGRAMENWGLIVYLYGWLLPHSNTSHFFNLETSFVAVHELCHQWFGNLVSPKWWTYTWLNEGLSTFYSYKIMDMIFPEWKIMDYGINEQLALVTFKKADRGESTLPLTLYVENQNDIIKQFGEQAYYKATYILQMIEGALSPETFRKAIVDYLTRLQYSVADEDDFLESLQKAATEDKVPFFQEDGSVAKFVKSWTHKSAYPVVTVIRDYNTGTFVVKQKEASSQIKERYYWWIPITFATATHADWENKSVDALIPNEKRTVVDPATIGKPLSKGGWLILNKHQLAPYRVQYDEQNWKLIIRALHENPKSIPAYNRAQLIRDALYFYNLDSMSFEMFFDLLSYLQNEDEVVPAFEALDALSELYYTMRREEGNTQLFFQYFIKDALSSMLKTIGLKRKENHTPAVESFQAKLFELSCTVDAINCTQISNELFQNFLNGKDEISWKLKHLILCKGLEHISDSDAEKFVEQLKSVEDVFSSNRGRYLYSIRYCSDNRIIHDFVENLFEGYLLLT